MSLVTDPHLNRSLRRAAVRAARAPSVHNTQPWRFVLDPSGLEVHADPQRRLRVLDPKGRQMMLSCGCAVFNARVAMAGSGYGVQTTRFPDPDRPGFLARIAVDRSVAPDAGLAGLDPAIELRQTNRRRFSDEAVPAEVVGALVDAAAREGVALVPITRMEDRLATARLSQLADQQEISDPSYRAELRAWTSDDPSRPDGVLSAAVPHVDAGAQDDVPIRDFDTRGTGGLPTLTRSSLDQCLLLLGTDGDDPTTWLRAGEGLERVLLEIAGRGCAVSPFTQVIEVPRTNAQLREELRLELYPHVLLRVGYAPATPTTRRRRLVDVLTEVG